MAPYLLSVALAATTVLAYPQAAVQTAYGQCGGQNYNGPTQCTSGWTCVYSNPYYSQCLPGGSSTTSGHTTTATTTQSSASSASSTPKSTTTTSTTTSPAGSSTKTTITTSATTTGTSASGNPFVGKQMYANSFYSSEVMTLAVPSLPTSLKPAASQVATIRKW